MARILTVEDVEFALRGGAVFACGGGGWTDHGRELGTLAVTIGRPELVTMDEVPDDAWLATVAAIGAPGGLTDWQMLGVDYLKAVQLLQEELGEPLYGLIIGQNGMSSTLNAWLPAAVLGAKVVDAVGDLRAHPTADMGSLGLTGSELPMIQTAAGGNRGAVSYIELVARGRTARVSPILRRAADMAGGFIASCRNPVRAGYVRKHAVLGGIRLALELGRAIASVEAQGGEAVVGALCRATGGRILGKGEVIGASLQYTSDAFDVGRIEVATRESSLILHIMNEYMAVDDGHGHRLSTYPDVITTLDCEGHPISAGAIREGMQVQVFQVPRSRIPLSSSVADPSVYPAVEKALGIDIAIFALGPEDGRP